MKKPNERHAKAELAKARSNKTKQALKKANEKSVFIEEDVENMTGRLLHESRTSLRREIFKKSCSRVANEFMSDVKSKKDAMEDEELE